MNKKHLALFVMFLLFSTIMAINADAAPTKFGKAFYGGLSKIDDFFEKEQYKKYTRLIDFAFFFLLFLLAINIGLRQAFKDSKLGPQIQVLSIVIAAMMTFGLLWSTKKFMGYQISIANLLPFAGWFLFFLIALGVYLLLISDAFFGKNHKFWVFLLAIIIVLILFFGLSYAIEGKGTNHRWDSWFNAKKWKQGMGLEVSEDRLEESRGRNKKIMDNENEINNLNLKSELSAEENAKLEKLKSENKELLEQAEKDCLEHSPEDLDFYGSIKEFYTKKLAEKPYQKYELMKFDCEEVLKDYNSRKDTEMLENYEGVSKRKNLGEGGEHYHKMAVWLKQKNEGEAKKELELLQSGEYNDFQDKGVELLAEYYYNSIDIWLKQKNEAKAFGELEKLVSLKENKYQEKGIKLYADFIDENYKEVTSDEKLRKQNKYFGFAKTLNVLGKTKESKEYSDKARKIAP